MFASPAKLTMAKRELGTLEPDQDGYRKDLSIDKVKTLAGQTKIQATYRLRLTKYPQDFFPLT